MSLLLGVFLCETTERERELSRHPMSIETEHAHSHPSPFSLGGSLTKHITPSSPRHIISLSHNTLTLTNLIPPATLHLSCLHFPSLSPTLSFFLACSLCLEPAYFAFFLLDGHSLSFSHLCFFLSAPSLRPALWLCESQISALSGWRLHHQLPSLTPYLTFSLPFLCFLSFY